jgi:hypothetical protein
MFGDSLDLEEGGAGAEGDVDSVAAANGGGAAEVEGEEFGTERERLAGDHTGGVKGGATSGAEAGEPFFLVSEIGRGDGGAEGEGAGESADAAEGAEFEADPNGEGAFVGEEEGAAPKVFGVAAGDEAGGLEDDLAVGKGVGGDVEDDGFRGHFAAGGGDGGFDSRLPEGGADGGATAFDAEAEGEVGRGGEMGLQLGALKGANEVTGGGGADVVIGGEGGEGGDGAGEVRRKDAGTIDGEAGRGGSVGGTGEGGQEERQASE